MSSPRNWERFNYFVFNEIYQKPLKKRLLRLPNNQNLYLSLDLGHQTFVNIFINYFSFLQDTFAITYKNIITIKRGFKCFKIHEFLIQYLIISYNQLSSALHDSMGKSKPNTTFT